MRVLILVNPATNYKNFFYNTAKSLTLLGHTVYYAFDSRKNTILNPISDIDNSENSFFFDEYLKKSSNISSEYLFQSTWGEYYYSDFDRFLTHDYNLSKSREQWILIRKSLDSFFNKILIEKEIDLVLYENISNSFEYSAYKICQLLGKQYFGLISARLPGRYEIQSSIIEKILIDIEAKKIDKPTEEELLWYYEYKKNINKIEPDYMKQNGLENVSITKKINKKLFYKIFRSIFADIKYGNNFDYASGGLFRRLLSSVVINLKRRVNSSSTKKYFIETKLIDEMKLKDDYYVYPMHYHPESSTSVLAPEYTNEFHNILNISNNLPFGVYLYVKDHRSATGLNSNDFYHKISALPAVKLIPASYNIKDLIKHSSGLITVNSTAGFEALILEKPVYLLGNVFYRNFENVYFLENFRCLKKILNEYKGFNENPLDIIAYRRVTYSGLLNFNSIDYLSNKDFFDNLALNIQEKFLNIS